MNVLVMFFNPSQLSIQFIQHTLSHTPRNAVNTWHFQSQIILNWLKKAEELWWETHHSEVMFRQRSADAVESGTNKQQECH
jgi:hypothetical protein